VLASINLLSDRSLVRVVGSGAQTRVDVEAKRSVVLVMLAGLDGSMSAMPSSLRADDR